MLGFDFKALKRTFQEIGRERGKLAKEVERIRQDNEWLDSAELSFEDEEARRYRKALREIKRFDEQHERRTASKRFRPFDEYGELENLLMGAANIQQLEAVMWGMMGPEGAKAFIRASMERSYKPTNPGPPLAERKRRREKNDAELIKLEKQLVELDDEIDQVKAEAPRERLKLRGKTPRGNVGLITAGDERFMTQPDEAGTASTSDTPDGGQATDAKGDGVKVVAADGAEDMINAESDADEGKDQ